MAKCRALTGSAVKGLSLYGAEHSKCNRLMTLGFSPVLFLQYTFTQNKWSNVLNTRGCDPSCHIPVPKCLQSYVEWYYGVLTPRYAVATSQPWTLLNIYRSAPETGPREFKGLNPLELVKKILLYLYANYARREMNGVMKMPQVGYSVPLKLITVYSWVFSCPRLGHTVKLPFRSRGSRVLTVPIVTGFGYPIYKQNCLCWRSISETTSHWVYVPESQKLPCGELEIRNVLWLSGLLNAG